MEPLTLGKKYDKIATSWHNQHDQSLYGVAQLQKAIGLAPKGGQALDVGCGAGGRFVRTLQAHRFRITGLDVSAEMIRLASRNHPEETFLQQDIGTWQSSAQFDFIVAWDSIFHLPLAKQRPVISKLCRLLAEKGVLIYTFGHDQGEHTSNWNDDTFYYSSIGINGNLQCLIQNGLTILHLELDQYPESHVYVIASKL
ncbi:MAG: class I SAM-dependent methyltransferase [Chloroflexota bacterium]